MASCRLTKLGAQTASSSKAGRLTWRSTNNQHVPLVLLQWAYVPFCPSTTKLALLTAVKKPPAGFM
jgi:hypothetical protein